MPDQPALDKLQASLGDSVAAATARIVEAMHDTVHVHWPDSIRTLAIIDEPSVLERIADHPAFVIGWPIVTGAIAFQIGRMVEAHKERKAFEARRATSARLLMSYLRFSARQLVAIQPNSPTNAQAHFDYWIDNVEDFKDLKPRLVDLDNGSLEDRLYQWYKTVMDDLRDLVNWRTMEPDEYLGHRGSNDAFFYQINGETLLTAFRSSAATAERLIRELLVYAPTWTEAQTRRVPTDVPTTETHGAA